MALGPIRSGRFNRDDDEDPPVVPGTNMKQPPAQIQQSPRDMAIQQAKQQSQAASQKQAAIQQAKAKSTAKSQSTSGFGSGYSGGDGVDRVQNTPQQNNANLQQQALSELLGQGPRDTAGDEARIQEMLQSTVGQGQADLNARMAAGGMGTSGALSSMSSDMRRMAARDAAQEISGIQQGARDEWLNRVNTGLGAYQADRGLTIQDVNANRGMDINEAGQAIDDRNTNRGYDISEEQGDRELDITEQQWASYIAALNAANAGPNTPRTTTVQTPEGEEVEVTEQPGEGMAGTVNEGKYGEDFEYAGAPPSGTTQVGTDEYGNTIWQDKDGKNYLVPAGRE